MSITPGHLTVPTQAIPPGLLPPPDSLTGQELTGYPLVYRSMRMASKPLADCGSNRVTRGDRVGSGA